MKRCTGLFALSLIVVVWTSGAARASERIGERRAIPPGTPEVHTTIGTPYLGAVCTLGENSAPRQTLDFIRPPDDFYYVYLNPDLCGACAGTDTTKLESATINLFYDVNCTIPVRVSVVGQFGGGCVPPCNTGQCPNDNVVFWGPATFNLAGTAGAISTFTLDLGDTCFFTGKAYLKFEFFQTGTGCSQPWLVYGDPVSCPLCTMFNLNLIPPLDDMCDPNDLGRPLMYASVASCVTPTLPHSWGSLKAIYRRP